MLRPIFGLGLGLSLAAAGCAAHDFAPAPEPILAIRNVAVVDVESGRIVPDRTILIAGGAITSVMPGRSAAFPASARQVDGTGKFLIPGLWDMHVHIADEPSLGVLLANGIVGVRDMGGGLDRPGDGCESLKPATLRQWRSEIRRGQRIGPELVISGQPLSGTGWPTSIAARTPEEARAGIARLESEQVDFVKIYERIPRPAYLEIAALARTRGLHFAGHVVEDMGLLDSIRAGQRSIEHIRDPLLMCFTPDPAALEDFFVADDWKQSDRDWGRAAHAACPRVIDALRSQAAWLTPTLTVEKAKVAVEDDAWVADPRRRLLPQEIRSGFSSFVNRKRAQSSTDRLSERLWWRAQQMLVGRMHAQGIGLLAGTDSACQGGLPGHSLHGELQELVAAGLTPLDALRTATIEPARYLARPKAGRVGSGMEADLVLLDANPLLSIANTRKIAMVIKDGRIVVAGRALPSKRAGATVGERRRD